MDTATRGPANPATRGPANPTARGLPLVPLVPLVAPAARAARGPCCSCRSWPLLLVPLVAVVVPLVALPLSLVAPLPLPLPLVAYPRGPPLVALVASSLVTPGGCPVGLPCAVSWWHTTAAGDRIWPCRWRWWGRDGFDHGDGGRGSSDGHGRGSSDGHGGTGTAAMAAI